MSPYLSGALSEVNSAALRQRQSAALCNLWMRTVEETRRLRLMQLVAEFGSYVALNKLLDLKAPERDSSLSQIVNRSIGSKSKKPKTMGSDQARRLETACKKPAGWMDTDPEQSWPFGSDVPLPEIERLPSHLRERAIGALNTLIQQAAQATGTDGDFDPGKKYPPLAR